MVNDKHSKYIVFIYITEYNKKYKLLFLLKTRVGTCLMPYWHAAFLML